MNVTNSAPARLVLSVLIAMAIVGELSVRRGQCAERVALPTQKMKAGWPAKLAGSREEVFKKVGDTELKLYIFQPADHKPVDRRPAIVFFFGGGWNAGTAAQFEYQARYLASRGMVAVCADYRVRTRQKAKVIDCIADAKSAIRYIRSHAARLGIDAEKVVAAGGSAGGHLAACTALLDEFDEANEDAVVSSKPNALVLFNPAVYLAPRAGETPSEAETQAWLERAGAEPTKISPFHHIRKGLPPTLILIGTADGMFASNEEFTKKMIEAGNRCELEAYADMPHGFFNVGKQKNHAMFRATLERTDVFLASLGYLSGPGKVADFFE